MDMSVWRVYWPCHLLRPLVESTEVLCLTEGQMPCKESLHKSQLPSFVYSQAASIPSLLSVFFLNQEIVLDFVKYFFCVF